MKNTPLVSVCMVSYNQESYVRDALDGVLMQKVDFDYEIIVSDDCSKDNTVGVLYEYQKQYPEKIIVIVGEKNVGYPNNQRRSLEKAKGKYIALCDSDDYWTDPYKLQKQIDYLEEHPNCVICFHNVMNIYEGSNKERTLLNPLDFPTELTANDVISRKWFLPTNSEVFRREFLVFPEWYDSVLHIDYVINLLIAFNGELHYMPDVMAVYRHTNISVSKQHEKGKYGYMVFHTKTMKNILQKVRELANESYYSIIDERLSYYDKEIKMYEKEEYYENHLLPRLFRIKTYKRLIKRIVNKYFK